MSYYYIEEGDSAEKFGKTGCEQVFDGTEIPVKDLHRIVSKLFIVEELSHSVCT